MKQAQEAAERAKNDYEEKAATIEQTIESRVQERIASLNLTQPRKIKKLEEDLNAVKRDRQYVCDAIERYLNDNGIDVQEFESIYQVNLGTQNQDFNGFDDIILTD